MSEYKCVCCGEVRESENSCTCPNCGYKMFQLPYDRADKLREEIEGFVSRLEIKSAIRADLLFTGKAEDDKRFPDYARIRQYVSSGERAEEFRSRLLETTEALKLHYMESFSKEYPVSFENLDEVLRQYDALLLPAARILHTGNEPNLDMPAWEAASVLYAETLNRYLWFSANELLGLVEKLVEKIVRFIKANNLYGSGHRYYPEQQGDRYTEDTDFKDELENAVFETEKILGKKYVVDIMDDGTEELREMLTCLWNDIELVMRAPLLMESYDYLTVDGSMDEKAFFERVSSILQNRYAPFDQMVDAESVLGEKTEEELFEIYKSMVEIDKFGFLIPAGTNLINVGESEKKLHELIGLAEIKESIKKIKAYVLANKGSGDLNIHMCFLGNPGSGKTEVARHIAGILYENRILPTNKVVEVDRNGLVSPFFGATAEKTSKVISQAMGGVLFIDEAYALGNSANVGTDYGKEAIDTLVKAMEDCRGRFCVILAGYRNEMLQMLSTNPGFKSRIQFMLDFPNYSRAELEQIAERMLKKRSYTISNAAMNRVLDITDIKRKEPNFANARELRNILDQVIMCQNLRRIGAEDNELGLVDVNKYIQDAKLNLPTSGNGEKKILTGEEELDQLIGLAAVKRMIRKIKAYAKRNRSQEDFNLHMCFYGNPGTGKTEVARILSRILYDAGVLPEAKLVETDAHGLMGRYVGETAPKTLAKINDAMNGVLFIDEAYGLMATAAASGGATNYGEEAIAVLLKEMEDRRGQFCVILAGYKAEMKPMLAVNPGLESRIQFTLDFPDYTREELGEIAVSFLNKKQYVIDDTALERVLDVTEYYRNKPNFANARTVRNILDQVIMNQNLRTEDTNGDDRIILEDVEDYLMDEGIDLTQPAQGQRRIGFMA